MSTHQVSVRLTDDELAQLDALVDAMNKRDAGARPLDGRVEQWNRSTLLRALLADAVIRERAFARGS